jgi:sensor histidine kinase YesM
MILSATSFTFMIVFGIVGGVVSLTTIVSLLISEKEKEYLRAEQRQTELEGLLREIRFHHLSSQIQPHFLFNSLNAVSSLIRIGKHEEAVEATYVISSLLRYSLRSTEEMVELEEEMFHVTQYLKIQQLRFGKRLEWEIQMDEPSKRVKIPLLMIQPLVENACKYGIEPKMDGGKIRIIATSGDEGLRIKIIDDGLGISPEIVEEFNRWKEREQATVYLGIGLKNTQQRLRHYFADKGDLRIQATSPGTMCTITIREV